MKRFVSPPIDQFHKLRQPLTDGERVVFDFFNSHLSVEWEIYVQPHLNGLRPDFVLLHPRAGIAVFEVKDWNLDAMHY
ncbi:MAG: DNA helicase, partial [Gammaproteobacteria bacterium]|nr:DNA helicase [Gammaproteobacteria bacterium]